MNPIVLASSPLVGSGAMLRVADSLWRSGYEVVVPDAPTGLDQFVTSVAAAIGAESVLIGFSAAGPRLFQVAATRPPAAIVFLDARLPADGVAPDATPRFAEFLDQLPVDDHGDLPPWPEWWPDAIAELIPDQEERAAFALDCPSLPRSMLSQPIPAPEFDGPCGFVALGDGYADDAAEAERRGWPVTVLADAHHLLPVTEPDAVAGAVVDVIERLAP